MYWSMIYLVKKMKEYPPYSINSVISAICICFCKYLGLTFHANEEISSETLKKKVAFAILERGYPESLSTAFSLLCDSIANEELLKDLHTIVNSEYDKQAMVHVLDELIQCELLQQLGREMETPSPLNRLCLAILNPVNGTFYDGTAGVGFTAIDAYLYARSHDGKLEIHTQELNPICHAISVVRAFFYRIDSSFMYCGNTLTEPQTVSDGMELQTFDYSIMFPPLSLSWKDISFKIKANYYERFLSFFPPTSSADWLFAQHQFASLNESGKGIIALPSGALFNAATNKIREQFIRSGIIECIITLPPNMLPHTGIPISLMVLGGTKKAHSQVLMIQTDELFADNYSIRSKDASRLDEEMIKRICELFQEKKQIAGISTFVDIDILAENDWILLPSRYVRNEIVETEFGSIAINYPKGDDWLQLRSTGSFYRGINVSPYAKADENGEYKIINFADVQDGKIKADSLTRFKVSANVNVQKYEALPGDLLVSCKGIEIKTCIVPDHTDSVLLSINFIGIHVDQSKFNPLFIKYYLDSPAAQVFLQSKQVGTSITTLNTRDIEEIPIPKLSLEEQNQYVQELVDIEGKIQTEMERLYTQSKQARWDFYQKIGLGKIMQKGETKNDD